MSKNSLILLGAGGNANAYIDVIEQEKKFVIAGLIGLHKDINLIKLGYRIIGTDEDLSTLAHIYKYASISVGHIMSAEARVRLYELATDLGYTLPVIISPLAYVSPHARIGAGTIIMHGAIVNAGAIVQDNCIVNTRALIEHDAVVESHCHISTGAIVNGAAHVGLGSMVGSGAKIMQGVKIGKSCVVGMGLTVRHNQSDGTIIVN